MKLLAALALSALSSASIAAVSSSSLSVSWSLTDLDPSDGVNPWLAFGGGFGKVEALTVDWSNIANDDHAHAQIPDVFGPQRIDDIQPNATASVSSSNSNGFTVAAAGSAKGRDNWYDARSWGQYTFSLAPNTRVDWLVNYTLAATGDAGAGITFMQGASFFDRGLLSGSLSDRQTFFTTNAGASALEGLDFSLWAGADGYGSAVEAPGGVTPVPEPETYALMLAGLGMLAFRRRLFRL